jgi:hypothetical protein
MNEAQIRRLERMPRNSPSAPEDRYSGFRMGSGPAALRTMPWTSWQSGFVPCDRS